MDIFKYIGNVVDNYLFKCKKEKFVKSDAYKTKLSEQDLLELCRLDSLRN